MTIFEGAQTAAIWGFGREGHAALDYLTSRYPRLAITILNDTQLRETPTGVSVLIGDEATKALAAGAFDIVVKSPGISLYRSEIARAKAAGSRLTSGVNLWFADNPKAHTIAVTGTKGKSTLARLLHHMLTKAGRDVALIGNVGVAALGQNPGRNHTVLELSSYQIADMDAAPSIALVTNLYVDHTPWHGSIAQYHHDKLRLIENPRTLAVLNANSEKLVAAIGGRANVFWYGREDGFHSRGDRLYHCDDPVDTASFPLRGEHNLENLAGACTLLDLVGLHEVRKRVDLSGFAQLRHRLEEFTGDGGRICVNDSISTVPEATLVALRAYADKQVTLFLGGTDRGQDHAELFDYLAHANIAGVILLPDTGGRIRQEMAGRQWPFAIRETSNLREGVAIARQLAPAESVFLLSPAAPSFGQFRDFEERGDSFIALCKASA